jgi:hypothetical protein
MLALDHRYRHIAFFVVAKRRHVDDWPSVKHLNRVAKIEVAIAQNLQPLRLRPFKQTEI